MLWWHSSFLIEGVVRSGVESVSNYRENEGHHGNDPFDPWGVLHCRLENPMNIPMQLSRIFIREMTDMQIIELTEVGGARSFPIVIGLPEAIAIDRRLKGIEIIILKGCCKSLHDRDRRVQLDETNGWSNAISWISIGPKIDQMKPRKKN